MNGDLPLGDLTRARLVARLYHHGVQTGLASGSICTPPVKWPSNLAKAEPQLPVERHCGKFRLSQRPARYRWRSWPRAALGADLLLNLRSKGTFEGRGIMLAPDSEVREVSGSYRVDSSSGLPRLLLADLQVFKAAKRWWAKAQASPTAGSCWNWPAGESKSGSQACSCRCIPTPSLPRASSAPRYTRHVFTGSC